jgi:predicted ABC-type ATPase
MSESELDARAAAHAAHLERLCVDGGPLTAESPHATTNNPEWFTRSGGQFAPTAARAELHRRLLGESEAAHPHVRQDREAIVLAGPPGAGKSTAQADLIATTGRPADHFRVVNADDFKDKLLLQAMDDGSYERHLMPPEVRRAQAAGERFYPRELASLVHEESSLLAKSAIRDSIRRGDNLVVDGTLSGQKSAGKLFEQLEKAGYKVTVASVEAPRSATQSRIAGRWRGGYKRSETGTAKTPLDAKLGGRWVPGGLTTSLYPHGPRQSVCRDVAEWARQRFPAVQQLQRYRINAVGTPTLEQKPAMATSAARNGRAATRPAPATTRSPKARATSTAVPPGAARVARPRPAVGRPGPLAVPKMAVPQAVARRAKAAKALPPKPHRKPDRGHGR